MLGYFYILCLLLYILRNWIYLSNPNVIKDDNTSLNSLDPRWPWQRQKGWPRQLQSPIIDYAPPFKRQGQIKTWEGVGRTFCSHLSNSKIICLLFVYVCMACTASKGFTCSSYRCNINPVVAILLEGAGEEVWPRPLPQVVSLPSTHSLCWMRWTNCTDGGWERGWKWTSFVAIVRHNPT